MRLTFWIYFDNPGEKEKLKKIMDEPSNPRRVWS